MVQPIEPLNRFLFLDKRSVKLKELKEQHIMIASHQDPSVGLNIIIERC